MSIIKKLFLKTLILSVFLITFAQSEDLTKLGTFKDWNAVAVLVKLEKSVLLIRFQLDNLLKRVIEKLDYLYHLDLKTKFQMK